MENSKLNELTFWMLKLEWFRRQINYWSPKKHMSVIEMKILTCHLRLLHCQSLKRILNSICTIVSLFQIKDGHFHNEFFRKLVLVGRIRQNWLPSRGIIFRSEDFRRMIFFICICYQKAFSLDIRQFSSLRSCRFY